MGPNEQEVRGIYRRGEDECVAWMLQTFGQMYERIESQDAQIKAQNDRIEALEKLVKTNSQNSSKSPSQDPFRAKKKPKRRKKCSKRHSLGGRKLRPVSEVSELIDIHPERCSLCTMPLSPESPHVGMPTRHQQVEIPEPTAILTEYLLHTCLCRGCKATTQAALPPEATSSFGPRLKALIATLAADKRQSTRQLKELLSDLYGVEISTGAIAKIVEETGTTLLPAAAHIKSELLKEAALYADETSWRIANFKAWLWASSRTSGPSTISRRRAPATSRAILSPLPTKASCTLTATRATPILAPVAGRSAGRI